MVPLIRDVVTQNEQTEFQNDVQLSWYPDDPKNLALATHYIFTGKAPDGRTAAVKLLDSLRESFLHTVENRHVVIATFGHGKTHLALALANYFGKPADSPEVQGILENIAHVTTPGQASGFRDFKEGRAPFLVIRLRGDVQESLPEQLLRSIETALQEHPGTRGATLPFWFQAAENRLDRLSPTEQYRANEYLGKCSPPTDLPALRQQLANRNPAVYELVQKLFYHLFEVYPDFGRQVNLADAIRWVADAYCEKRELAGGVIILFDEFSAFLRSCVESPNATGHTTPLQDLLNGVVDRPRKVVFVAFAQYDPNAQVADLLRRTGNESACEDIRKELTRLPQRYLLHSSLETVLDAYLKQDPQQWEKIRQQAVSALEDAVDCTQELFRNRYTASDGWSIERLSEVIVKGCFPLHPLTTALLCSMELSESGASGRRILKSVFNLLKERGEEPALIGNTPNWTYATTLVDWFGDMLSEEKYRDYDSVCRRVGAEAPEIHKQVLKAMLLHTVANLKWRSVGGYAKVISLLCGYTTEECAVALRELKNGGFIREESNGNYSFYSAGTGGDLLEKRIRDAIRGKTLQDVPRETLTTLLGDEKLPITAWQWGHSDENTATQHLLLRTHFTAAEIRKIATPFRVGKNGIQEAPRARVIWSIAQTEEDVQWFRKNAAVVLDEALQGSDHPQVVLVALPKEARPDFAWRMLCREALKKLPQAERKNFPTEVIVDTEQRYEKALASELEAIRSATEFVVPAPYRNHVQVRLPSLQRVTVEAMLDLCVEAAYTHHPPAFFTTYKANATNLRKAVYEVSQLMAARQHRDLSQRFRNGQGGWEAVARELCTKFIQEGKPGSWGLITLTDRPCEPTSSRVKAAWEWLDRAFPADQCWVSVNEVLITLLNPPFGYDYNQAMILFCAWYGMRRHDVWLQEHGALCSLDRALRDNHPKPKDFILDICYIRPVRLSRRDGATVVREIEEILKDIGRPETPESTAWAWKTKLEEFVKNDLNDPSVLAKARDGIKDVDKALERATAYRTQAQALLDAVCKARDVGALVQQFLRIGKLPPLSWVSVEDALKATAIQETVLDRLGDVADVYCAKFSQLQRIEHYALHEEKLKAIRPDLERVGDASLLNKVDNALSDLAVRHQALRDEAEDARVRRNVAAIPDSGGLYELRQRVEHLGTLKAHTEETQQAISSKKAALEAAIAREREYAEGLAGRLATITTVRDALSLREEVNRRYDSFAKAPEQQLLDEALCRCGVIEQYIRQVEKVRSCQPQTPEEEALVRAQGETALNEVAAQLSEVQRELFAQACEMLSQRVVKLQEKARAWLADRERDAASGADLVALTEEMGRVPAFLPKTADIEGRLAQVRLRVRALLAAGEEERRERELDAPAMAEVRAMRVESHLGVLRSHLQRLSEIHAHHADTKSVIEATRQRFAAAEQSAVDYAMELAGRTAALASVKEVRSLQSEIRLRYVMYEGEPEQEKVDAALRQCAALEKFLERVEAISQERPSTPAAANALFEELDTLPAEGAVTLSAVQQQALDKARASVARCVEEQRAIALQWLAAREREAEAGANPGKVLEALSSPPPFLPSEQRERVEKLQANAQARHADAPIIAAIKGMRWNDTLAHLRAAQRQLEEYKPATTEAQKLIEAKQQTLQNAITRMVSFLTQMAQRIDEATTIDAVRRQSDEIQRRRADFAQTEEEQVLEQLLVRCRDLEDTLRQLGEIRPDTARGQEDADRLLEQVGGLQAQAKSYLSGEQVALFEQKRREIEAYSQEKQAAARRRLQVYEAKIRKGEGLLDLQQALACPQRFLPPECTEKLEQLKRELQERLDQDEVRLIGEHFRRIKDKAKREQCLEELRRIAQEFGE